MHGLRGIRHGDGGRIIPSPGRGWQGEALPGVGRELHQACTAPLPSRLRRATFPQGKVYEKGIVPMNAHLDDILRILEEKYPQSLCALHYRKDYELMIAVRLSAQCTDARVNQVTPALFAAYPTLEAMAAAPIADVENYVRSCGFYKHKARDIVLACQMLLRDYGGKVPGTMEELLKLPGVGRKTANLLLGDIYGVPGSVVCDTHCIRICGRLGLSQGKEPEKVEKQLRAILPPEKSSDFCHRIVLFGREICTARNPKCGHCPLALFCPEMTGQKE